MNKRIVIWITALTVFITVVGILSYKAYLYRYVLRDAPQYPTEVMNDMVTYTIDPQVILDSLAQKNSVSFGPALKNPAYEDVPLLWPPGSFSWHQEDYLRVANALHQFVWKESLENWHVYSAHFNTAQCNDIFRTDGASFGFYQRQGNSYYAVHNMVIDLNYGYVYAGNDNGYYTGRWKDIELEKVKVNTADKALLIAEQNGGQEARSSISGSEECNVDVFFAPFVFGGSNWGWRVTYWRDASTSVFGIIIDPYTGGYEILK